MGFPVEILQLLYYVCLTVVAVFLGIYFYFKYSYTYWSRKGVPYLEPKFPLGNNDCIAIEATSYGIETMDWYNEIKKRGLKFGGAWSWAKPVLVLTDPDYIRDVLLKDFQYFPDRDFYHNPKYDKQNESLFVVEKEQWRNLRQKLSPTFTSAKMKMMFPTVVQCCQPMMELFQTAAKKGDDIDVKEWLASFTTDVIGCVAFGLEFGSFKSEEAKFRRMGKEVFMVDFRRAVYLLMSRICEQTAVNLGVVNIPSIVTKFFDEIITENVKYRRTNKINRPDFTQLLMDLEESTKNEESPFTFEELIANVILFFIAGFDTSSTTMHFALYELARQPKLQERTRAEIQEILNKYNGEFSYEAYQDMPYLRQVIEETLRKYPPVQAITRRAAKPYTFKDSNFTLEQGMTVVMSTIALGRDPEYYPDPERFDPERFTHENKAARNQYVYLPFGDGPRNCIGMRFGLMQSSIGLVNILRNYKITISPTTKMPLTLKHGLFLMQPNETLFLKAEKI